METVTLGNRRHFDADGLSEAERAPHEGLIAQAESFTAARSELEVLFPHHWAELALDKMRVPLEVDWDKYDALEKAGALLFVTLRKDGRIAGYYMGFVGGHLHYKSCVSLTMDIYWTHPSVRGHTAALRLMREVHRQAHSRGVSRVFAISKNHRDSSRLFAALGYRPIETVHSKWIAD